MPQLLEERGIDSLEILHCDVQGAETDVLQSCRDLLKAGRIRFCIVSTHSHHISGDPLTHQRCLALLQDAGGQILAEHDVHESYSGDGLIAAHFGETALSWPAVKVSRNRYSNCLFRNRYLISTRSSAVKSHMPNCRPIARPFWIRLRSSTSP